MIASNLFFGLSGVGQGFTPPITTPSQIVLRDEAIVTGVSGDIIYYPADYDSSGATKYQVVVYYGGLGDGRTDRTLLNYSNIAVAGWMKTHDYNKIVIIPQSSTGGWETFDRVKTTLDKYFNNVNGQFKDVYLKVKLISYSAGGWGIARLIADQEPELDYLESITISSSVLSQAYTFASELTSRNIKTWIHCATGDGTANPASQEEFASQIYDLNPALIRLTRYSSLPVNVHTNMQDQVYNDNGITEVQETGNYLTSYPYYEWTSGSWWDY